MIEETAHVVQVQGKSAWVETVRTSTCSSCKAKEGCGTALLARVLGTKRNRVQVIDELGVQDGDRVTIGLEEEALVRGSLAIYGVPLAGLLGGAVVGSFVGTSEWTSIVFSVTGFCAALVWVRWFSATISRDHHYQARILRKN